MTAFGEFWSRFGIDRSLGCSRFSRVYSATELTTGHQVMLKLLLLNTSGSDDAPIDRPPIDRDLVTSDALASPHLVRVLDIFEDQIVIVLVLESVQARDLFQWIMKRGSISESATAAAATHVLTGLRHLHANGIVHLDLKPENVLVTESGGVVTLKLTDYCLAPVILNDDALLDSCATENCSAPEISASEEFDGTADVWSLGVMLYIILSGKRPFRSGPMARVDAERAALERAMEAPEWRVVSPAGKDFVQRCLRWDREERMTVDEALAHPWLSEEIEEIGLPGVTRDFQIVAMGRKVVRTMDACKLAFFFGQFFSQGRD
jgi:serine/threonine protein kinase